MSEFNKEITFLLTYLFIIYLTYYLLLLGRLGLGAVGLGEMGQNLQDSRVMILKRDVVFSCWNTIAQHVLRSEDM